MAFADDLRTIADMLGIDKMAVIGLSGGGPYALGVRRGDARPRRGRRHPRRRCARSSAPEAITRRRDEPGHADRAPAEVRAVIPLRIGASLLVQAIRPVASTALYSVRRGIARGRPAPADPARVQGDVPRRPAQRQPQAAGRRRSTTSSCSPGTGDSGSTRSRSRSAGGTATTTTSFRSRTVSTWCPCCPTPSCSIAGGESSGRAGPRRGDPVHADEDLGRAGLTRVAACLGTLLTCCWHP